MPGSAYIVRDWRGLSLWLRSNPIFFQEDNRSDFSAMELGELYLVDEPVNHMSVFRKIFSEEAELVRTLIKGCDELFEIFNGVWRMSGPWAGVHAVDILGEDLVG